jgi:hypothetical protein
MGYRSIRFLVLAGILAGSPVYAQEAGPAVAPGEGALQQDIEGDVAAPAVKSLANASIPVEHPALLSTDTSAVANRPSGSQSSAGSGATRMALYAAYGTLQALDVHSTLTALDNGGVEGNPLVRTVVESPAGLIAVKAASTAGFVYVVEKIRKKNRTAAFVLAIGVTSLQAYVVAHNYSVAKR